LIDIICKFKAAHITYSIARGATQNQYYPYIIMVKLV